MRKKLIHRMKIQENAYFTVEAAMVLPIIIGVIVLLIYLLFFQYNRCLMEQDMGALALRGCSIQEDEEPLMQTLMKHANEIYAQKYIAWDRSDVEMKLHRGTVKVIQRGELRFPFSGLAGNTGSRWSATAGYENRRVNPVNFIRLYRKVTGGM